ncbi:MAG TPA: DUF4159 domain-containing protein [Vicinamibacterales bacterium]|nr:DUF4159 domain-containing protein [Vicinamibacterales bacterium]
MFGRRTAAAALAAAIAIALAVPLERVAAQVAGVTDERLSGLTWQFVRIKYRFNAELTGADQDFYGEPWFIDGPAAEQNLSRRLRTATSIQVEDPRVMTLDDPDLFAHPWIYMVEPGNLALTASDASTLREFLLRGGTLTFDDFHGPFEWDHLVSEMKKVFPDRQIEDFPAGHPVFSSFYKLDGYPQIPGLGSFLAGRTWEKGGFTPHLRTIFDDNRRPMLYINWNTDMGDGWEWSNAEEYPDYIKYTSQAYRMEINEIVYALTH